MARVGKKEALPPLVIFTGEADDIKAEGLSRLKQAFRSRYPTGQLRFIDGGPQDLLGALEEAQTPSLFHEPKLIVFLNAQKALNADSAPALVAYLRSPVEEHFLVLLGGGGRKDAKTSAALKQNAWSVECSPLAPWKAVDWVSARFTERGLRIGRDTAQELLDRTGCDVTCIRQALDTLETVVRPRTYVETSDLRTAPLPSSEQGAYELMDAVGKRNGLESLRLLRENEGEDRGAAPLLYQRVRELLKVALLKSRGLSQPLAATELGLNPYRLKSLWEQAARFNAGELRGMLRELIELQAATVTGRLGKTGQTGAMEAWVLKRITGSNR